MSEPTLDDVTQAILERAKQRKEMLSKMINSDNSSSNNELKTSPSSLKNRSNSNSTGATTTSNSDDVSPNKRQCLKEIDSNVGTPIMVSKSSSDARDVGIDSFSSTANQSSSRKLRLAALAEKLNEWEDESNIHYNIRTERETTPSKYRNKFDTAAVKSTFQLSSSTTPSSSSTTPSSSSYSSTSSSSTVAKTTTTKINIKTTNSNNNGSSTDTSTPIKSETIKITVEKPKVEIAVGKTHTSSVSVIINSGGNGKNANVSSDKVKFDDESGKNPSLPDTKSIISTPNAAAAAATNPSSSSSLSSTNNSGINSNNNSHAALLRRIDDIKSACSNNNNNSNNNDVNGRGGRRLNDSFGDEPTRKSVRERLSAWKNRVQQTSSVPMPALAFTPTTNSKMKQSAAVQSARRKSNDKKKPSASRRSSSLKKKSDWTPGGKATPSKSPIGGMKVQTSTERLQKKLIEQVQSDSKAQTLKKERENELAAVGCRWETEKLNDDDDDDNDAKARAAADDDVAGHFTGADTDNDTGRRGGDGAAAVTPLNKKEEKRNKLRSEFDCKLKMMGFDIEDSSSSNNNTNRTSTTYFNITKNSNTQHTSTTAITNNNNSKNTGKPHSLFNLVNNNSGIPPPKPPRLLSSNDDSAKIINNNNGVKDKFIDSFDDDDGDCGNNINDDDDDNQRGVTFGDVAYNEYSVASSDSILSSNSAMENKSKSNDDCKSQPSNIYESITEESAVNDDDDDDDDNNDDNDDDVDVSGILDDDNNNNDDNNYNDDDGLAVQIPPNDVKTNDDNNDNNDNDDYDDTYNINDEKSSAPVVMRKHTKRRSGSFQKPRGYISLQEYRQQQSRPKSQPPPSKQQRTSRNNNNNNNNNNNDGDGNNYYVQQQQQHYYEMHKQRQQQQTNNTAGGVVMRNKKLYPDLTTELNNIQNNNNNNNNVNVKERIKELQELVNQEMNVIHQTSNALNKCCHDMSVFAGSAEAVECNRLLLVACKKREAYLIEMQKLKENPNYQKVMITSGRGGSGTSLLGPQGRLTISDIRLPIKGDFLNKLGTIQDMTTHYFLVMIRHETHIMFTQMTSTHDGQLYGCSKNRGRRDYLEFPNLININNVGQDFDIVVEIYGMSVTKVSPSDPINSPRKKTPKKTGLLNLTPRSSRRYETSSGVGSAATTAASVRSTNFIQLASIKLNRSHVSLSAFALERIPQSCPIQNCVMMNLKCMMENVIERKDFLTMFEDVSGLGAWHRRWFSLKNGVLSYWKYPDDELYKEPLGTVDLKTCITASVGLVTREVCARPNTFEIETMRNKRRGDRNTLIQTCNDKLSSITTKHWLSADTKEDRESWCRSLNEALVNLRAWHADAMRPISKWPQ